MFKSPEGKKKNSRSKPLSTPPPPPPPPTTKIPKRKAEAAKQNKIREKNTKAGSNRKKKKTRKISVEKENRSLCCYSGRVVSLLITEKTSGKKTADLSVCGKPPPRREGERPEKVISQIKRARLRKRERHDQKKPD